MDDFQIIVGGPADAVSLPEISGCTYVYCQALETLLQALNEATIVRAVLLLESQAYPLAQALAMVREAAPHLPILVALTDPTLELTVDLMRLGAFDLLAYPIDAAGWQRCVAHLDALSTMQLQLYLNADSWQPPLSEDDSFSKIITQTPAIQALFDYCRVIAPSIYTVLITGETGTGKELFARAIHDCSGLKGQYVVCNAGGLDDLLFADTLFGHQRGAYTGAVKDRAGLIEAAAGGTLFLDEIGELSAPSQVKLLRLLQDQEYLPLGSDIPKKASARIIVATNRDLFSMQEAGTFRKDLYYRLITHQVKLPPLRERLADIPLLFDHFLLQAAKQLQCQPPSYAKSLLDLLKSWPFPGNIRELAALCADAVARTKGTHYLTLQLLEELLPDEMLDLADREQGLREALQASFPLPTFKTMDELLLDVALERAEFNQSAAAKMLGVTHQAINRRLNKQKKLQ